ncbi:MAG TPA: hypothetical protein VHP32_02585 [Ignavibacteria bacterium]|nr:hypothetical protein [Ignavibacteria bacterium]
MLLLLNKFTYKELLEFEKFIKSPFFNTSERVTKLFFYLKSLYPGITEEKISRENIFKAINSGKKYDDQNARKLISDFNRIFEKYLAYKSFEKYKSAYNSYLSTSLKEAGDQKLFNFTAKKILTDFDNNFNRDNDYYYYKYKIENDVYYANFDSYKPGIPKIIKDKSKDVDFLFAFMKLHIYNEVLNIETAMKKKLDFDYSYYDSIMGFVKQNETEIKRKHPDLYVIYLRTLMYKHSDEFAYVKELINYIRKNARKFNKEKLNFYYTFAAAFYWEFYNKGDLSVIAPLFSIYNSMMKAESLIMYNKIFAADFNCIVLVGLHLEKYDWLENFIYKYGSYLDKEIRKDLVNLALARLHFRKNDFEKAISFASKVKSSSPIYYVNINFIFGKSFFEQNDIKSLEYILDNLKHYKSRNKQINKDLIDNINIFNFYMTRLIKIYDSNDEDSYIELKNFLKKEKRFVPDKRWLIEKIKEKEKSFK